MIIDMHIHPYCKEAHITPDLETGLKRQFECKYRPQAKKRIKARIEMFSNFGVDEIVKEMDESNIDKAVIVSMDMTSRFGVISATNEDVSNITKMHPDRFIPFAGVDPSLGAVALDTLKYAVEELGCRGVKLCPPVQMFDFSDPRHDPLWKLATDLDIIVWTHTAHQQGHFGSDARLGAPMLLEPVAIKHPDMKLVMGHCGFPWVWEAWSLVARHPNVYIDISAFINLYNHFPWDAYTKFGWKKKYCLQLIIRYLTGNKLSTL